MDNYCLVPLVIICGVIFISFIANSGKRNNSKHGYRYKGRRSKRKPSRYGQMIYIYRLKDGRKAFYVGQTVNPERRLSEHIGLDGAWTKKHTYINNMRNRGKQPKMEIITKTRSKLKADKLERKYIQIWGKQNTLHR